MPNEVEEVKKLQDEIGNLSTKLDEIRTDLDKSVDVRVDATLKKRGFGESKEIEARITEDLAGTFLKLEESKKILERIEVIENTKERISTQKDEREDSPAVKMYESFLSSAFTGQPSEELRAYMATPEVRMLVETVDPAGGFLVPEEISGEIIKDVHEFSDVRKIARVSQTKAKQLSLIRRVGIPTATRVSETGSGTASEPTYKKVDIPAHPAIAKIPVSEDLLEDAVINLRSELSADASLAFAILEGAEFVNGHAVNEPEGFMTNSDVGTTAGIETVANTIEPDDFYNLIGAVATPYRIRGRFVFNTATWILAMRFKSTTGQYIWQSGFVAGGPPTIAGKPYTVLDAMPNEGSGLQPICFGDFMIGYRIVDRTGMTLQAENITDWPNHLMKFRIRNGGGVAQPGALRKLQL